MSLDFASNDANYLTRATSYISATDPRPVTYSFWYRPTTTTSAWIWQNNAGNGPRLGLAIRLPSANCLSVFNNTTGYVDSSQFTMTIGAWHHFAVSLATDNKISFYVDGRPMGTGSDALAGGDTTSTGYFGRLGGSGLGASFSIRGCLAEWAVFRGVLSGRDVARLANYTSPRAFANLYAYSPMRTHGGTSVGDHVRGDPLTVNGTLLTAAHPPIRPPPRRRSARGAAATGPTGTGAATAPAATSSGTGRVVHKSTGTPAATAPAATSSGTGRLVHEGTGAATAPAATSSGSGILGHTGSGSATSPAATSSGTGRLVHDGSGSAAAGAATSSGAGILTHLGSGSATAPAATSSGSALTIGVQTGSGSATAPAATSSGAGRVVHKASGSATAPAATSGGMAEQAGGTAGGGKGGRGYRRRRRNHDGDGHGSVGSTLRRHDAPQPRVAAPRAVVAPAVLMALAFDDYEL